MLNRLPQAGKDVIRPALFSEALPERDGGPDNSRSCNRVGKVSGKQTRRRKSLAACRRFRPCIENGTKLKVGVAVERQRAPRDSIFWNLDLEKVEGKEEGILYTVETTGYRRKFYLPGRIADM